MIFGEWIYGIFLVIAATVFRLLPARARGWWLAACGLAFYAYYAQAFLWLIIVEILVVYALTRDARNHRWAFATALTVALGALVLFKYGWLVSSTGAGAVQTLNLGRLPTFPQLVLPLAISFFTFEFIHYVIDARKGVLPPHSPADFFAFALFFPTMVAGPIKRFQAFQPQIAKAKVSAQDVSDGTTRIAVGLAKKMVIADSLAPLIDPLLSNAGMRGASATSLTVALLAFGLKIYMDFSGYSDIAIGSARLFGIRVPENFDWPYLRTNIAQFWRHWHMSLTSWITDYVYIPLGGNRMGLERTALNSIAAMAVSGLWHGAQWHFLAWGLYNGLLLAAYRYWVVLVRRPLGERMPSLAEGSGPPAIRALGGLIGWAITFSLVTLGWGLFIMPMDRFVEMLGRFL